MPAQQKYLLPPHLVIGNLEIYRKALIYSIEKQSALFLFVYQTFVRIFHRKTKNIMEPMISITVISKYEHDRKIVAAILAGHNDFYLASVGEDGYYAIKSAKEQRPDIIITDYKLDDIESPDLAPIIKRNSPSTDLITLYSGGESDCVVKALRAGISGCLLKEEITGKLAESVRCVFYGGLYLSQTARNHARRCIAAQETNGNIPAGTFQRYLSKTELCIFRSLSLGRTDREIARDLNISVGSLRNCVNRAKQKTGLKNRIQIAVYALLAGMINPSKIKEELIKSAENRTR